MERVSVRHAWAVLSYVGRSTYAQHPVEYHRIQKMWLTGTWASQGVLFSLSLSFFNIYLFGYAGS